LAADALEEERHLKEAVVGAESEVGLARAVVNEKGCLSLAKTHLGCELVMSVRERR